jgi:membrane protease YdiL (CAAX protease family)
VLGWLATVVGLGVAIVGYQAAGPARFVLLAVGLAILALGLLAAAGSQAIERKARGTEPYTGPSPVLLFAASIPIAYLGAILVGVVIEALGTRSGGLDPRAELLLVTIQGGAYIAVIALLVVGSGALTWADIGYRPGLRRALEDVGWGAIFAGPVIGLTVVATAILVAIFQVTPENPLPPTGQASGLLLHLLAGAVVAPVAEETLFRGVATTAWVRSLGVRAGIIRGALFFALAHVLLISGSTVTEGLAIAFVAFAARLPIAVVLGWMFVRRGSIYASIALHATFNGFLLVWAESATRAAS